MPDRVKQATFDMLASRYDSPGALPPLFVADVFAGGGSMGLEALSRGAAFCSFFERDLNALEALRGNIELLGAGQESHVVAGDAWRASMAAPNGRPFALIFLDPPYQDCEDTTEHGEVRRFLHRHGQPEPTPVSVGSTEHFCQLGHATRLVILHHPAGTRFVLTEDDPWRVAEERRIGSNAVTFFAR